MVKLNEAQLDHTFAALADPTRRAIVRALSDGERRVTDLARPFAMSLPAVSKHLGVLERAGLIERRKVGREQRCALRAKPMAQATDWLERYRVFWEGQLDSLAAFVEQKHQEEDRRE